MTKEATTATDDQVSEEAAPEGDEDSLLEEDTQAFLEDDGDDLSLDADSDAEPGEAEAKAEGKQTEEQTPEGETPKTAEPEAKAEAKPEPAKEPTDAPKAEPQAAELPRTPTPEELQQQYTEWRGKAEEVLSTSHFNLSEDQLAELEDNPGVAVPKLLSRVYLDAVQMTTGQILQMLPSVIETVMHQRAARDEGEGAFFEAWPALAEHRDTVARFGRVYMQLNPKATRDDFIRDVGAQAVVALRLPLNGSGQAAETTPKEAATKPFKPAATGRPAPSKPRAKNEFEVLAEQEEELDLD